MAPPSLLASLLLKITEEFPLNVTAVLYSLMCAAPPYFATLLLNCTVQFSSNVTSLSVIMYIAPP